eukprot:CCRYP_005057-RA/>CCRYP_005057-RA protein AED:0.35 eAED:0.36 QI:0/0/0/1/0/0/2/0/611
MNNSIYQDTSKEPQSTLEATKRLIHILDAKYEKADLRAIVKNNCTHLSVPEQTKLLELLQEFEELFSGKLGDWDCKPVSLQLKEGAQPYHGRPFPIPKKHIEITKREVQRLCDLGVLKWQDDSEWASPTFIIPKKDNTVRVVSDFREVNKRVVRKPFPIPKISTVLQELEGFTYATALDLNMGYYTIRLDPDASKICTIIFPWGKYSYLRLPMGVACSPTSSKLRFGECGHTKVTKANKTKKKPWHWDNIHQQAFDTVKATIARDVTLAYPDYSQGFEIYTDSSKFQLGAVITQNNRPLAFFSRKLSQAQQKYSVTEQELLAIVETLKEFKGMLWGQQITVYTDHKNLMQDALGLTSDRVYRWRLLLEEYGPTVVYIKGIHNTVADAISRLDYGPVANDRSTWMTFAQCWCYHNTAQPKSSLATTKESMNQVFANRNEEDSIYPLTTREIAEAQQEDESLLNKGYSTHLVENIKVLCKDGKMVIPKSLQHRSVGWFHHYLQHPGTKHLEETLRLSMYWKGLRTTVQSHVKKCHSCQVNKRRQLKYGKLPTKLAITNPWEALCVDLIGPYTLKGKDKTQIDFMCVTMIDPATSWFEIVELPVSQLQELDIPT